MTLNTACFRNDRGGIEVYRRVNYTEIEHMEDYQAWRLGYCKTCGHLGEGACTSCSGKTFEQREEDFEALTEDIVCSDGSVISAFPAELDPILGEPLSTQIPYDKPSQYPLVMRKNVSVYGQFLVDSDVDKIRNQQDGIKKAGTRI